MFVTTFSVDLILVATPLTMTVDTVTDLDDLVVFIA
jgi:hypothetical protein